jgi:hypothetical protein
MNRTSVLPLYPMQFMAILGLSHPFRLVSNDGTRSSERSPPFPL